eukprot:m.67464 g.67464  ORF g.67464 m.67464 type:complete len:263 (+) comp9867_c0_seq1:66-854(+)
MDKETEQRPQCAAMTLHALGEAALLLAQPHAPPNHAVPVEQATVLKLSDDHARALAPLLASVWKGDLPGVRAALSKGGDLSRAGGVPPDIFAWLPLPMGENGANSAEDPTTAAFLGIIQELHSHGAAVQDGELLEACARVGVTESPGLMSNRCLNNVATWATQSGFTPVLRYLVENGSCRDVPLSDACGEGRIEVLRYLGTVGGLPDPVNANHPNSKSRWRIEEAFSFARMSRQDEMVAFLIDEVGYSGSEFLDQGERHEVM